MTSGVTTVCGIPTICGVPITEANKNNNIVEDNMENKGFIRIESYRMNEHARDIHGFLRAYEITMNSPVYVRLSSIMTVTELKTEKASTQYSNNEELFPNGIIEYAWVNTPSRVFSVTKDTYKRLVKALGLNNAY